MFAKTIRVIILFFVVSHVARAANCANGDALNGTITGPAKLTKGYYALYTITPCGEYNVVDYDWKGSAGFVPDLGSGSSSKTLTAAVLGAQWCACVLKDSQGNTERVQYDVTVEQDPYIITTTGTTESGDGNWSVKMIVANASTATYTSPGSTFSALDSQSITHIITVEASGEVDLTVADVGEKLGYSDGTTVTIAFGASPAYGPMPPGTGWKLMAQKIYTVSTGKAERWENGGVHKEQSWTGKKGTAWELQVWPYTPSN